MKYEMIFGDERLFDGAPEDAEIVGNNYSELRFYKAENKIVYFFRNENWDLSDSDYPGCHPQAMRRIIKEPKRWTWEDKKAGLLPEVGSDVLCSNGKTIYTIEAVNKNENQLCVRDGDDGDLAITYTQYVTPIETPADKAQREEDEFVESTCRQNEPHSTLYSDGVRAAYRKLKGGE